jgi:hypothetical protein
MAIAITYLNSRTPHYRCIADGFIFINKGLKMRVIKKTIYTFSELSEIAKENAREWYRSNMYDDMDFAAEHIYSDASAIGKLMGIDLDSKRVQLMNGNHRYDPCIYYSGFSSQGDGACFEGEYKYSKGALHAVKAYAPKDKELARICKALQKIQKRYFYKLTATTKHSGHYYHSGCMRVTVDSEGDYRRDFCEAEDEVTQCMRDFADWIYSQLENESDYINSDESIDSNIEANEYEFDENGKRV